MRCTHTRYVPILFFALLHRHTNILTIIYNTRAVCVHRRPRIMTLFHVQFYFFFPILCYFVLQQWCSSFTTSCSLFPVVWCPLYFLPCSYLPSHRCVCAWIGSLVPYPQFFCYATQPLCVRVYVCVLTTLKFISEYFVFCCNGFSSGHFITFFFLFMQHCKLYTVQLLLLHK